MNGLALNLARLYLGAYWILHGAQKLLHPPAGATFANEVQRVLPQLPSLTNAQLVAIGGTTEVTIGVFLVLGLLTRIAALGSLLAALAYFIESNAYTHLFAYAGMTAPVIMLSFVVFMLPTGLFALAGPRRARQSPRVRAEFVDEPPFTQPRASSG